MKLSELAHPSGKVTPAAKRRFSLLHSAWMATGKVGAYENDPEVTDLDALFGAVMVEGERWETREFTSNSPWNSGGLQHRRVRAHRPADVRYVQTRIAVARANRLAPESAAS